MQCTKQRSLAPQHVSLPESLTRPHAPNYTKAEQCVPLEILLSIPLPLPLSHLPDGKGENQNLLVFLAMFHKITSPSQGFTKTHTDSTSPTPTLPDKREEHTVYVQPRQGYRCCTASDRIHAYPRSIFTRPACVIYTDHIAPTYTVPSDCGSDTPIQHPAVVI